MELPSKFIESDRVAYKKLLPFCNGHAHFPLTTWESGPWLEDLKKSEGWTNAVFCFKLGSKKNISHFGSPSHENGNPRSLWLLSKSCKNNETTHLESSVVDALLKQGRLFRDSEQCGCSNEKKQGQAVEPLSKPPKAEQLSSLSSPSPSPLPRGKRKRPPPQQTPPPSPSPSRPKIVFASPPGGLSLSLSKH